MARQIKTGKKHETGRTITTKSPYGTHNDMIVSLDEKLSKFLETCQELVVAQDDVGPYLTYKNRVDNGLADPCRFDAATREAFSAQLLETMNNG